MITTVRASRRLSVAVSGEFPDSAIAIIKSQMEQLDNTRVEDYQVFTATKTLPHSVCFHVVTDRDDEGLKTAVLAVTGVSGIQMEEV